MSSPDLHLTETQWLLVYGLEFHGVPRRTAIPLVRQFSEAHILRELSYLRPIPGRVLGRPMAPVTRAR